MSVYWLGDFVFVESGLGVRVKFDLTNTVYVTVTAEHKLATRGLCGVYNGNADGEKCADTVTLPDPLSYSCKCSTGFRKVPCTAHKMKCVSKCFFQHLLALDLTYFPLLRDSHQ